MNNSIYVENKDIIDNVKNTLSDRIDIVNIYMQQALTQLNQLQTQQTNYELRLNAYIKEKEEFDEWYSKQNFFKKLWWNIKKFDYKRLKSIKDGNNNI